MHTVAVVALPDVIAFDLTTAVEMFGRVQLPTGGPGYRVLVCGTEPVVTAGPFRIATDHGIGELAGADTIVVPGRNNVSAGTSDDALLAALRVRVCRRHPDRVDLLGCVHPRRRRAARRKARDHSLACDRPVPRHVPAVILDPDVLCRRGSGADVGGRFGRHGSVPAHGCDRTTARPSPPMRHGLPSHPCTAAGDRRSSSCETPPPSSTSPNAPNSTMCWHGSSRRRMRELTLRDIASGPR